MQVTGQARPLLPTPTHMELGGRPTPLPSLSRIPSTPHPLPTPSMVPAARRGRKSRGGGFLIGDPGRLRGSLAAAAATTLGGEPSSSRSLPDFGPPELGVAHAVSVVRDFYEGINRRDLAAVAPLISDACVYEDLIFSRPFVGRQEILDFFRKFTESISSELQFVIDDISKEDSSAVGVTWHLEWRGKPFPFSKGCSFYRLEVLDGKRQIVYGRDCVEPATKPGDLALILIRGVTSILRWFPQLADRF